MSARSMNKLTAKNNKGEDVVSVMDKYDFKANEFRNYFPMPIIKKSEEEML